MHKYDHHLDFHLILKVRLQQSQKNIFHYKGRQNRLIIE